MKPFSRLSVICITITLGVSLSSKFQLILEMLLACDTFAKEHPEIMLIMYIKQLFEISLNICISPDDVCTCFIAILHDYTWISHKACQWKFHILIQIKASETHGPSGLLLSSCPNQGPAPAFEGLLFSDLSLWILLHNDDFFKSL